MMYRARQVLYKWLKRESREGRRRRDRERQSGCVEGKRVSFVTLRDAHLNFLFLAIRESREDKISREIAEISREIFSVLIVCTAVCTTADI
jgi:hypothetical protein